MLTEVTLIGGGAIAILAMIMMTLRASGRIPFRQRKWIELVLAWVVLLSGSAIFAIDAHAYWRMGSSREAFGSAAMAFAALAFVTKLTLDQINRLKAMEQ